MPTIYEGFKDKITGKVASQFDGALTQYQLARLSAKQLSTILDKALDKVDSDDEAKTIRLVQSIIAKTLENQSDAPGLAVVISSKAQSVFVIAQRVQFEAILSRHLNAQRNDWEASDWQNVLAEVKPGEGAVSDYFNSVLNPTQALAQVVKPAEIPPVSNTFIRPEITGPEKTITVADFMKVYGIDASKRIAIGDVSLALKPIRRILIANNGMAAHRIAMATRDFARIYLGDPRAIEIIAVATPDDIASRMAYVNLADRVIAAPKENGVLPYNNIDRLISIAKENGADAIHPGWGWQSENADFAKAAEEAGITFMGPTSSSMTLLGNKIRSNLIMQWNFGKEVMAPWSGESLTADAGLEAAMKASSVRTVEEAKAAIDKLGGYPVMIKVADLGGGKGMKPFFDEADFEKKFSELQRAASNANSQLYVMALSLQQFEIDTIDQGRDIFKKQNLTFPVYFKFGKTVHSVKLSSAEEDSLVADYKKKNNLDPEKKLEPEDEVALKSQMRTILEKRFDEKLDGLLETASSVKAVKRGPAPKVILLGGGQRHIEVQVMADLYGNTVALWARDCSGQRNNQKVSEETCFLPNELTQKLMKAGVEAAKKVGYTSLGTVEFLVDPITEKITFLEVNTRVQVEHAVTEGSVSADLIVAQFFISMGVPLNKIPQIKDYYFGPDSRHKDISFDQINAVAETKTPDGHVIAFRLQAEHAETFTPSAGKIVKQHFQSDRNAWAYFAYDELGEKGSESDAQIGHLFARGKTREEAIQNLSRALERLVIFGDLETNIPFLKWLIRQPEFLKGEVHNKLYEKYRDNQEIRLIKTEPVKVATLSSIIQAFEKVMPIKNGKPVEIIFPGTPIENLNAIVDGVSYEFTAVQTSKNGFVISNKNNKEAAVEAQVDRVSEHHYEITINGKKYTIYKVGTAESQKLLIDGVENKLTLKQKDPSKLNPPMQGKIVKVLVKAGETVAKKQGLFIIEAMKMEKEIESPLDGKSIKEIMVSEGQVVKVTDVLLGYDGVEPPKPLPIYKSDLPFDKPFYADAVKQGLLPISEIRQVIDNIFENYPVNVNADKFVAEFVAPYFDYLKSTSFWASQVQQFVWSQKVPESLKKKINEYLDIHTSHHGDKKANHALLSAGVLDCLRGFEDELKAILELSEGKADFKKALEIFFHESNKQLVKPAQELAADLFRSYHRSATENKDTNADKAVEQKGKILAHILANLEKYGINPKEIRYELNKYPKLTGPKYNATVSLVEKVILSFDNLSTEEQVSRMRNKIAQISSYDSADFGNAIAKLAEDPAPIFAGLIPVMIGAQNADEAKCAALVYATRTFREYPMTFVATPDGTEADKLTGGRVSFTYRYNDEKAENRFGQVVSLPDAAQLEKSLPAILDDYQVELDAKKSEDPSFQYDKTGIMSIITRLEGVTDDQVQSDFVRKSLVSSQAKLESLGIKRVTVAVVTRDGEYPSYFTFRIPPFDSHFAARSAAELSLDGKKATVNNNEIQEDLVYRHIEPPLAFQLDYERLKQFGLRSIPAVNKKIYTLDAIDKKALSESIALNEKIDAEGDPKKKKELEAKKKKVLDQADRRIFVRSVVRSVTDFVNRRFPDIDSAFENSITTLRNTLRERPRSWNEIFVNILPSFKASAVSIGRAADYVRTLVNEQAEELHALRVQWCEFKICIGDSSGSHRTNYRILARNAGGSYEVFVHKLTTNNNGGTDYTRWNPETDKPLSDTEMPKPVGPIKSLSVVDRRERFARDWNTTYAYKWPSLIKAGLDSVWSEVESKRAQIARQLQTLDSAKENERSRLASLLKDLPQKPESISSQREMYLNKQGLLVESSRDAGSNLDGEYKNGAVVFRLKLKTPEYPSGREVIFGIFNDVNHERAPFGPREAKLYVESCKRAIKEGIPFIATQSNIGASFDIEALVVANYKPSIIYKDPAKGFADGNVELQYMYFDAEVYEKNADLQKATLVEKVVVEGKVRYKIVAVPGITEGLDADSLNGSGAIAGISDKAWEEIFTMSLVTKYGAIGIGSYLGRLLHRMAQNGPVILTGYKALNALLNKDEKTGYSSDAQLGGANEIMLPNGVAHWGMKNDAEGVKLFLRTLRFIPKDNKSLPPKSVTLDPLDRKLVIPTLDKLKEDDLFYFRELSDKGSFHSDTDMTMHAYGKPVLAGRILLGGRPVGMISVQYNPLHVGYTVPKDPGDDNSLARPVNQAVRVLTPDASYKLAESVKNFSREGIPSIIMTDWRGFSGGTRDMYDEVLKFGSMIVEALRTSKTPVLVYIPPFGELRGGAWVVFDRAINHERRIRFYADTLGRGGVLEPSGVLGVKEKRRLPENKTRFTPQLSSLVDQDLSALTAAERADFESKLKAIDASDKSVSKALDYIIRTSLVGLVEKQQTAKAMEARGTIDAEIPWPNFRERASTIIEHELELLDFERDIRRVYPELSYDKMRPVLDKYSERLSKTGETTDPDFRKLLLGTVAEKKMVANVASALEFSPLHAMLEGLKLASQAGEYHGLDLAKLNEVAALMTPVLASIPTAPSLQTRFEFLSRALKDAPLWAFEKSDADDPRFYDCDGREYLITNPKLGIIRIQFASHEKMSETDQNNLVSKLSTVIVHDKNWTKLEFVLSNGLAITINNTHADKFVEAISMTETDDGISSDASPMESAFRGLVGGTSTEPDLANVGFVETKSNGHNGNGNGNGHTENSGSLDVAGLSNLSFGDFEGAAKKVVGQGHIKLENDGTAALARQARSSHLDARRLSSRLQQSTRIHSARFDRMHATPFGLRNTSLTGTRRAIPAVKGRGFVR